MRDTFHNLRAMSKNLRSAFPADLEYACNHLDSLECKLKLLDHHCHFLENLDYHELHTVGTFAGKETLEVHCGNSDDITIIVRNPEAGKLMVFNSADGIVAAGVNIADTLGRMCNRLYGLGVDEFHANLPAVLKEMPVGSPLRSALERHPGIQWMAPLRRMRGECQHSAIASVIEVPLMGLGRKPSKLYVRQEYKLDGMGDLELPTFAAAVRSGTIDLVKRMAVTINSHPVDACAAPVP